MVPKIIKKHLLSSRVIKSLKDLTQDLDLAYDVSDITPMAIQLRKSYPHFEKGEIYYVWQLSGTVRNGESAGYNKHLIYKIKGFYEQVGGRNGVTEYYMYDATNIRLRELSLGYTLPKRLLGRKQFLKKAELSFVARNLFFIYKKAPFDPDAVLSASNSNQGIDIFGIPTTRSVGFNVKLSF